MPTIAAAAFLLAVHGAPPVEAAHPLDRAAAEAIPPFPAEAIPHLMGDTVPAASDTVQTASDTVPRYRTDDIEVTVTRTEREVRRVPYAVGTVDGAAFHVSERGATLADALWRVPGIFAQDRRNFALGDRISVRGAGARAQFGVRGIRVLLDGIPLTLPDGQTTLENLDLAGIAGAEVIRGPAAALYGNAAAGVLSFRSERPGPEALRLEPRVTFGSHGWREMRLQASGRSDGLELLVAGSRLTTDGFREHADAEILRGTAIVSRPLGAGRPADRGPAAGGAAEGEPAGGGAAEGEPAGGGAAEGEPARGELRALLNVYRSPWARNPGSLSLEDALERPRMARSAQVAQGTGKETNHVQAGLSAELPIGDESRFRAAAWGVRREVWNPIPGTIIDLERWSGGVRGELGGAARLGGLPLRWEAGTDLEVQWDDRLESDNLGVPEGADRPREGDRLIDQAERVLGIGPFVQVEAEVAPGWTATVAGRLDHYAFRADDQLRVPRDHSGERSFRRFSPMAGITWSAADAVRLFANATTAFQTPTTSELSNRPDGAGGFHPDLGPETIISFEVGARGGLLGPRLGYAVSAFTAEVRDALVPLEGATGEVFFRNAGEVERRGVEVSATWLPAPSLRADLAYTRHRSRFVAFETAEGDFTGNEEPGVPGHTLALALLHRATFGLRSELRFRWVDAYAVDDANSAFNPAHRVVDLRLSLDEATLGWPFRPFLGIDNLFDERFNGSVVPNAFGGRYYEPSPGFEMYGGLELAIPRQSRKASMSPASVSKD